MKVRFGQAQHGWLPMELDLDGMGLLRLEASYLPYDFVGELVAALSGLLQIPGEYVARMCEEPAEYEWRFRSHDPSVATFEIVRYQDRSGKGEVLASERGSPLDLVLPIWRALRELESRAVKEGYRSHWSGSFPCEALGRLSERIERMRVPDSRRTG